MDPRSILYSSVQPIECSCIHCCCCCTSGDYALQGPHPKGKPVSAQSSVIRPTALDLNYLSGPKLSLSPHPAPAPVASWVLGPPRPSPLARALLTSKGGAACALCSGPCPLPVFGPGTTAPPPPSSLPRKCHQPLGTTWYTAPPSRTIDPSVPPDLQPLPQRIIDPLVSPDLQPLPRPLAQAASPLYLTRSNGSPCNWSRVRV